MTRQAIRVVTPALVWFLAACSASEESNMAAADLAIVGADVLTMEDSGLLSDQTVLITGKRITTIGPSSAIKVPAQARVIDARGQVLMPGLVDAHIHLRHADSTALVDYLRAGVTLAREMNGRPFIVEWRDRIDRGELDGPWLQVAAPTMANFSSPREGYPTPETREEAAKAVRHFSEEGYTWIKVYTFLPRDAFEGVIEEASKLSMRVAGHVPIDVGLTETIASGIRSIEHLTEYVGNALTPDARELDEEDRRSIFGAGDVDWATMDSLVEATANAGVWNVPTLVWFDRISPGSFVEAAWSKPELRAQGARTRREIVRRLHEAGAPLAVGTDSDAGDDLAAAVIHDELAAMVDAGIGAYEVLRLAIVGGATLLGVWGETGSVSVGKRADLLLLPCDPRNNLRCLRELQMVIMGGRVVVQ